MALPWMQLGLPIALTLLAAYGHLRWALCLATFATLMLPAITMSLAIHDSLQQALKPAT